MLTDDQLRDTRAGHAANAAPAGAAAIVVQASDRVSLPALLGWAGFALLVLYVILLGGGWIGIYSAGIRVFSLAVVAVGLAAWSVVAWRRPEWRPRTAMWPALALPLASFVLSTAASPFPRLGLDYVAWAVLLTALYLLLVRILALPYARARIGGLAAVLALVLGGAYVLLAFVLWAEWWGLVGEIRVPPLRPMYLSMPWGGPSAVLTVQVLLTAVAMAGLGITTRSARVTVALLAVLAGAVAVISGSRSGWLALAGALVLVAGLWLLSSSSRASLTRALRRGRVRVALVVVGAVVLVAIVLVGPAALDRFVEGGDGGRPVYWATALRMFAEAPVLGLGPGNWAARRIAYTEAGELDFYIPHAHNQLLETGAEFGLLGLAAGTVAVGCVAWLVVTALRGADQARRRWAWAVTFVLVYLAAATLVDSYTFPAILLPVAIAIAYLDATSHRALGLPHGLRSVARPLGRLAILGLLASSIAAVAFLARSESVALTHARGVAAANLSDWDDALAPSLEAAEADPGLAPYQVTAGLAAAGVEDWATAEAAFHAAATTDDLPASWLGLALAQSELGRPVGEVSDSLGRAMRLGEQQPAIAFAAAELYDRLGMVADADDAYAKALAGLPSLGADVTWRASLEPAGRIRRHPGAGHRGGTRLGLGDRSHGRRFGAGQGAGIRCHDVRGLDPIRGDPGRRVVG